MKVVNFVLAGSAFERYEIVLDGKNITKGAKVGAPDIFMNWEKRSSVKLAMKADVQFYDVKSKTIFAESAKKNALARTA